MFDLLKILQNGNFEIYTHFQNRHKQKETCWIDQMNINNQQQIEEIFRSGKGIIWFKNKSKHRKFHRKLLSNSQRKYIISICTKHWKIKTSQSLYEINIILMSKLTRQHKNSAKGQIIMKIDAMIWNKYWRQQLVEKTFHHDQVGCAPRLKYN